MANTFRNDDYRPAKIQSYIAIASLAAVLFCAFLFIVFSFVTLAAPDASLDLGDGDSLNIGLGLIGITAILRIPLFIATVVFFLIWEHRAFNNLSALKARNLEFSPGWAVGWWFIPFANLVKPFQAMRELYNESDPDFDPNLGFLSSSSSAPAMMGFWWACWIIGNIFSNISSKLDDTTVFPVLMIISSAFEIIAGALLIKIILDIVKRQDLRFKNLGASERFAAPPPPPTFNNFQQ